jgi:predicted  nucleic acid-binding Zn-ribbon protein
MTTDTNNEVARLRAEVQRAIEDRNRIGIEIRGEYLPKLKKSENEVERLDHLLADASETNHKLAAEVDMLNNILENTRESRATIIEDRNLLDQELAASRAEVAKLNHQLLKTESDLLQSQDISFFLSGEFDIANARANKAEAEVERLTGILKSLRKSPSTEWHKSNKVLLK